MTTDTKGVARWDGMESDVAPLMVELEDGDYVLFTDHEQVVAELTEKLGESPEFDVGLMNWMQARNIMPDSHNSEIDLADVVGALSDYEGALVDEIDTLRSALAAKSAEVEGLAKDAERWRFLAAHARIEDRDGGYYKSYSFPFVTKAQYPHTNHANLGEAIDAAMGEGNGR